MTTVNPYLTFNGNCEEAFNFYGAVFGRQFQYLGRYKDMPKSDRANFAMESDEKIMHVSLPISDQSILMGCDTTVAHGQPTVFGNNISLSISTDNKPEADRLFNGLSLDGQVKMEMNETFWGSYFGVVTDKFGIHWQINCEL